ncbi:hypothetical protein BH09MYX1_BH09MYX1_68070 [soil metagenome]
MHALTRALLPALAVLLVAGCHRKVTQSQCDTLVDHYAELAMKEQFPDAAPADIDSQKKKVREESKNDDDFKNCTSEIETADFDCAMKATTTDAIERCLE